AEDGIRDFHVTGVQTCALPISPRALRRVDGEQRRGGVVGGDRVRLRHVLQAALDVAYRAAAVGGELPEQSAVERVVRELGVDGEIGRASCRESVELAAADGTGT